MVLGGGFSRIDLMLGRSGTSKLSKCKAIVIGLGGVGSYAAESLARSGVGAIMVVDGDVFEQSNLNRQLCALISTLGKPKSEVVADRIKDINNSCRVVPMQKFIGEDGSGIEDIFTVKPDVVIEAIDTVQSKIALLMWLQKNKIPVVSCMGAALRKDPFKIKVAKLDKTTDCPLAAKIRKAFRAAKIKTDFPCVYSTEKPSEQLLSITVEKNAIGKTPLGSMITVPAVSGLIAANEALKILLGELWTNEK